MSLVCRLCRFLVCRRIFDVLFCFVLFDVCVCVDRGGDVRRHGDRAHPGRQGPDPRAEAHPPNAEGTLGALLGKPLHGTVRGE